MKNFLSILGCNPCYNGNLLQHRENAYNSPAVVILVIMEIFYNLQGQVYHRQVVVILVIMEIFYNPTYRRSTRRHVVILVIMEIFYNLIHCSKN